MAPTNIPMFEYAFNYGCTSIKKHFMEIVDSLSKLKYDGESNVSSSNHIWAFLLKCKSFRIIDDGDLVSKLFTLTLRGRIKCWFESLLAKSIHSWEQLFDLFRISHWNYNCNELHLEMENIHMHQGETLEQFFSIFMSICFGFCKDVVPSNILDYFCISLYLLGAFDQLNNDKFQSIISHKYDTKSIHDDEIQQQTLGFYN